MRNVESLIGIGLTLVFLSVIVGFGGFVLNSMEQAVAVIESEVSDDNAISLETNEDGYKVVNKFTSSELQQEEGSIVSSYVDVYKLTIVVDGVEKTITVDKDVYDSTGIGNNILY